MKIDYSSLHFILTYTEVGIDYWDKTSANLYDLSVRGVTDPDHCRDTTKLLLLLGFNASDGQSLFKAIRSELDYTAYPCRFPDDVLFELLNDIEIDTPRSATYLQRCRSASDEP